jgi:hypothetical protein
LPEYQIIPVDTLYAIKKRSGDLLYKYYDELHRRYNTRYFSYLSTPLFSRDMQTVIVGVNFSCVGLCGGGDTFILRRTGLSWRILRKVNTWAS